MQRVLRSYGILVWCVCVMLLTQAIGQGTPVLPLPVIPEREAQERRVHYVAPSYPAEARKQCLQGKVVLKLHVDETGAVVRASVVSGETVLADAAKAVAKHWMYQPHLQNGRPTEFVTQATVIFNRPSGCSSPEASPEVYFE
jgi:TonB family protein